jgi:hypothetical protein
MRGGKIAPHLFLQTMFWYFLIGIIILYVVYRLCATLFFPKMGQRQQQRYRDEFLKKNSQIDKNKLPPQYLDDTSKKDTKIP